MEKGRVRRLFVRPLFEADEEAPRKKTYLAGLTLEQPTGRLN